jgi:hypothetical protein
MHAYDGLRRLVRNTVDIDKEERDELLARWQRCHREVEPGAPLDQAVCELIDEACKGVGQGRINTDRCAHAGETFGWAWRTAGMEISFLVEELAAVRRSVWDTVVARLREEAADLDAAVGARAIVDLAFDVATRRALDSALREARSSPEGAAGREAPSVEGEEEAASDFHAALNSALFSSGNRGVPLALLVLHFDPKPGTGFEELDPVDISELLGLQLRHRDQAFQLTELDYALICTDTNAIGARHLLSRISAAVTLYATRAGIGLEVSGGCAVAPDDGLSGIELIRIALADREFSASTDPEGRD